jgi:hypothetical protein
MGYGFGPKKNGKKLKPGLKAYQGLNIGGRRISNYSQIRVTHAGKKTTKQKLAGGIGFAIL